jgi:DNA-directed RNA polymerase subunit M/transcription elongation factor TFIIS
MNTDLGKLIKTTQNVCPDCSRRLELRQYGEKQKLVCQDCEYEEFVEVKRIRRREEIEEQIVEPRKNYRSVTRRTQ